MKRIILMTGAIFLLTTCTTESDEKDITYSIENTLSSPVTLKFYSKGAANGPLLKFQESIDGTGIILSRTLKDVDFNDSSLPLDAFGADSLAVIFNNSSVEAHADLPLFPDVNSIFDPNSYTGNVYRITQTNLDNAIPCDGACD